MITGIKGSIFLPDFQHAVKMTVQPLDKEAWDVELPVEINGFEYEIREVSRCVAEGKSFSRIHSPQDSIALIRLMDEIRQIWRERYGENGYRG